MLIPLSKIKIGDEITISNYGDVIRGHLVARDHSLCMVAWEEGVATKKGYAHWVMGGERKRFPNIPAKYTTGWWWSNEQLCEVIPKVTNNIGFLTMCIAAGAGMSAYVSKPSNKRVGNLNHKASRI